MDSFVIYRSFHEALKDLDREQYGNVMFAINEYALNQIEPELSGVEKMAFTLIKPQLDANIKKQSNGKYGTLGGRPKKEEIPEQKEGFQNKNPMGYSVEENKNPMGYFFEENKNPNANANLNANENLNDNANENEKDEEHAPAPIIFNQSVENYSNEVFNLFKNAGLPCCNENPVSFLQRDFKFALEYLHNKPELQGIHSNEVMGAVKNYIAVINNPNVFVGYRRKKTFDSFVNSPQFMNYLPDRFVLDNFLEHKKVPSESSGGVGLEKALDILNEELAAV